MKKKTEIEKYKRFLDKYKSYVGMGDYRVVLEPKTKIEGFAEVDTDYYEKIIKISLSDKFYETGISQRKNILFHELVHARIDAFDSKVNKLKEDEEEEFVNDIVRGFEKHKRFEFKEAKDGTKRAIRKDNKQVQ